jgi:anti-sigma B factor antagonist
VNEAPDTNIVTLEGEIDLALVPDAERQIAEAEASEPARLVIDLTDVTFMDSSGLRVILTAHRRAEEAGRSFAIVKGGDTVNRLLEVTGLSERLELLDERPAN